MLDNLEIQLSSRYERAENLQDLKADTTQIQAAVRETPEDHPALAAHLSSLGSPFSSQYERTRSLLDLEAAIAQVQVAVESTPEDHPDRAKWLNNPGNHLHRRHSLTVDLQDLEAAHSVHLASCNPITAPLALIQRAANAADKLVFGPSVKDLPRASSLLRIAIHLMPLATSRSLEREDQQHILGQLTGLVSLATSVLLEAGESPLEALRLLELGRSVTNGQLLDYRSDISDLRKHYPTLAEEFHSLRQKLDSAFPSLATESPEITMNQRLQPQRPERSKVARDLNNILLQIRQKPKFENFLGAESEKYLLSAAQEGPIVMLNATKLRSDGILVTKTEVKSIALPRLSYASMMKYCSVSIDDNKDKREMLQWLWKAAVEPILRELGLYPKKVDPLPRIWWIGVGLMAKAPIHAAAKFKNGSIQLATLQYCLPSYTSTIRALQYSRSRDRQCPQNAPSMLIVTMPTTPGESPLSGVTKEANEIKHGLCGPNTVETLERPTAKCVLHALPNYSIAHFACHGVSSINPADSHLLLLKESILPDDHRAEQLDKLRVKDIAALKLPAARLAYLSACSTAVSTSSKLIDEVTHTVSSFHIAGFIHVIGTLWESEDEACQRMAVDFYSNLRKTDNVAVSYRTAIMKLMEQKPSQPRYWAPFIHFGA